MIAFQHRKRCFVAYRSVRVGAGVHSRYLGSGRVAELAWEVDRCVRERRVDAENGRLEALGELETADRPLQLAENEVRNLFGGQLHAVGFYQHAHSWRRRGKNHKSKA